jgi:hypothetical protein
MNDPIVHQIVDRQHVSGSDRTVIKAVIRGLRRGYQTWRACPKAFRRAAMQQVIARHRDNQRQYQWVMGGHA